MNALVTADRSPRLFLKEEWRAVVGYEGRYEVSDLGRVKSLLGRCPLILRQQPDHEGYLQVTLYAGGASTSKTRKVHHLVLEAFVGPRPEGAQTRHLNDIKSDNWLQNLVWGTGTENQLDISLEVRKSRGRPLGHPNKHRRLTADQILQVRALVGEGKSFAEAARQIGSAPYIVSDLIKGKIKRYSLERPNNSGFSPDNSPAGCVQMVRV
jgi:hypothetical protein